MRVLFALGRHGTKESEPCIKQRGGEATVSEEVTPAGGMLNNKLYAERKGTAKGLSRV